MIDERTKQLRELPDGPLPHIEIYALRITRNPDAHPFDKDNAIGIVEICRANVAAPPAVPTAEMIEVGAIIAKHSSLADGGDWKAYAKRIYEAMVATDGNLAVR